MGVAIAQGHREYERLTTTVLASLRSHLEHGGNIKGYRLAAQSSGEQLRDVKIWVQEPNPNWVSSHFSGRTAHFPYRLWRPSIGSEPDGCSINPKATEFFGLLRSWISSTGDLQVELDKQTFQAPLTDWVLPLKIEWSVGSRESEVLVHRAQDQLELTLHDFTAKQSKWSRSQKWGGAVAIIVAIGVIIVLLVYETRRKPNPEKLPSVSVSKPEAAKSAVPSVPVASEAVPQTPADAPTRQTSPVDRLRAGTMSVIEPTHTTNPVVSLIFTDSPLFTPERKRRITGEIDGFYMYLKSLGFPVEKEVPPLGVSPHNVQMMAGTFPGTLYDRHIYFPKNSLNDPDAIRKVYASYVFRTLFGTFGGNGSLGPDFTKDETTATLFAVYYTSSLANRNLDSSEWRGRN